METRRKIKVEHFYNEKNQPVVTIATIEADEEFAAGVAICSKKDRFNGKLGRKIALGRAFLSLKNKNCSGVIAREEAIERVKEMTTPLNRKYKMYYFKGNP